MSVRPLRVFLFMGQSNMAGADAIIEGGEAKFIQLESDKACYMTYSPNFGDDKSAQYVPWGSIKGHIVPSTAHPNGFVVGPEVGFCRELFLSIKSPLAIIKCCGNIPIKEKKWLWGQELYIAKMMNFIHKRLNELQSMGWHPVISGVVWWQGIDDAFHKKRAKAYTSNLKKFIALIRHQFNGVNIPWIIVRSVFSPLADSKWMKYVRDSQVTIASSVKHVAWIDIDDLELVCIHHLSAKSQLEVGRRLAIMYQSLCKTEFSVGLNIAV
jgi:hypothetical protein